MAVSWRTSQSFHPGKPETGQSVYAVFSVMSSSSTSGLLELLLLGTCSGECFFCAFDNGLSTGHSVCVERAWLGRNSCLVGILEPCGELVPESPAMLSQGLCVETVRKKGIPEGEGR